MTSALLIAAAYLIGSFPTSQLVAKVGGGIDLRQYGSGNVGATNLFRALGWRYAVPAAIVDVAKGTVPVATFPRLHGSAEPWFPLAIGTAAVLGHVFSAFLRFKGGKGVATAAGAVVALAPQAFLLSALAWLAVLLGTRYMSAASMVGALAFPVAVRVTTPERHLMFGAGVALALFILFTHRSNLTRLMKGTEQRIGRQRGEG